MCCHFIDAKNKVCCASAALLKNGKTQIGVQRYICKSCKKTSQEKYVYQSYGISDEQITLLTREGCGIRSSSRILEISPKTVIRRIMKISRSISRPYSIVKGKIYELDELFTYIGNKNRKICIAYSLEPKTGNIIDFVVGRRNKTNLRKVTETLILSEAKMIYTDKLNIYRELIPKEIHQTKNRGINHIERNNLSLRTHIKRLNRKTICFSKSLAVLTAVVKIYFWTDPKK